jgi:hypothetical protein
VAYSGGDAQTEAGTVTSIERPGYYHDRHGVPGELRVLKNALGNTLMTGVKKGEDFKSGPVPHAIPAKYGLMDTQGNVLVEPKWEEVRILSPEWVWIGVGDKCGIANAKGNVVLEPIWDEVQAISPEWLWFRKGDKCGLADATGKVVVEPEVDVAEVVKVRSASIDEESGELVLGPYGRPILTPWIRVRDQKRYRYLRPDGQPATPAGSDRADVLDFYGPKHVVLREAKDEQTSTWTLYEPSTNTRTPFPNAERLYWNWHMALSGFLWAKDTNDSKWKLMNAQGKDLGHAQDERPGGWEPRDGLGLLQDEKGWFFVNNNGDRVGGDGWTNARPYREGRAAVERDGKWGFIDTGGKVLVEPVWAETRDFKLGLAAVKSAGGLWGFVGTDGEIAVHPVWDRVQDFVRASGEPSAKVEEKTRRVALVYLRYDLACIDASGRLILEPDIFPKPGQEFIVHAGLFIQPDVYRVANRVAGWTVGGETDNISSKWNASLPIRWMLADTKGRLVNRVWSSQDRRYLWTYADDGSMVPQDETSRPSESNGYDQFDRMPFLGDVPLVQAGRWNEPFYDAKRTDPFSGGLITARSEEQKYALLRLDGTRVVPPVHDRIAWIAPGVAAVWSRDDGGLIGRDGNWLFRDNDRIRIARFGSRNAKSTAAQYRHGIVVIEDAPKWGYAELNR